MNVTLNRIIYRDFSTIGLIGVDGVFNCFSLEDKKRQEKIKGATCIPSGRYKIELRQEGHIHEHYKKQYNWHKGVLWLKDVPNFQYIYIHIGNFPQDTEGCILTGIEYTAGKDMITGSRLAYKPLYLQILTELEKGNDVYMIVNDMFF